MAKLRAAIAVGALGQREVILDVSGLRLVDGAGVPLLMRSASAAASGWNRGIGRCWCFYCCAWIVSWARQRKTRFTTGRPSTHDGDGYAIDRNPVGGRLPEPR